MYVLLKLVKEKAMIKIILNSMRIDEIKASFWSFVFRNLRTKVPMA